MSESADSRRFRTARAFGLGIGLSVAATAAVSPALAEMRVHQRLREHFGVDEGFAVELDLAGIELRGLARELPQGRGTVSAERVRIRPSFDGLDVEVVGLDARLRTRGSTAAAPSATSSPDSRARSRRPHAMPAPPDPLTRALRRLRGVPIHVETRGEIEVEVREDLIATARAVELELPGDGRILAHARFSLGDADEGPRWASAQVELTTTDANWRVLELAGELELDGEGGGGLELEGWVEPDAGRIELSEAEGEGRAQLRLTRERIPESSQRRDRLDVHAHSMPLALAQPLLDALGARAGRGRELELDEARVSGHLELERSPSSLRARFDALELVGLRVGHDMLAPEPLDFELVGVDGELGRVRLEDGQLRHYGAVVLSHRGVQVQVAGQLDPSLFVFSLDLPTSSCASILDALPGTPEILDGTKLEGELEAHVGLRLDFDELDEARVHTAWGEEMPELEDFDPPGELEFDFPFLERCAVTRLAPGIDVEGLAGAYHHRFVTGAGVEHHRVLARGDAHYTELRSVPNLALAFVILEDARFWDHDGFDREQIERAFWVNLLDGRVRRGASTISQQTARSLWLGVDRSISRKLGEALLAAELEGSLDKRRILELYLNVIELGPEIHGVAEAARYYFDKPPQDLDLREALHLASLAPAPVAYARRFASGEVDREWRDHLRAQVRRLRIRHLISDERARKTVRARLKLVPHPELIGE